MNSIDVEAVALLCLLVVVQCGICLRGRWWWQFGGISTSTQAEEDGRPADGTDDRSAS